MTDLLDPRNGLVYADRIISRATGPAIVGPMRPENLQVVVWLCGKSTPENEATDFEDQGLGPQQAIQQTQKRLKRSH